MKSVEAICIGDELLDGRVRDKNASHLGEFVAQRGQRLRRVQFVPDDEPAIVEALRLATSDVVVVSGGLGPTSDDITRDAAARWCECELVLDPPSLAAIRQRFERRGRELTPNNEHQAFRPACASMLPTDVGTAPGFQLEHSGRTVFFFPGVPREFAWYVDTQLGSTIPSTARAARRLRFHGLGESELETRIQSIVEAAIGRGLNVSYRADYPVLELKLSGAEEAVSATADAVLDVLTPFLVGEDDESLAARVGRLLLERAETVTTAESCTAGGIAALITEVSGSSAWFGRGYVTYANEAKMDEVEVTDAVLLKHGAVSAQTVCQMASGARRRARATYALAVSGIAGPTGGSPGKPVGTVHFGLATPAGTYHRHVHFQMGDRAMVRAGTAYTALAMLLWLLEDRLGDHQVTGPYEDEQVFAEFGVSLKED